MMIYGVDLEEKVTPMMVRDALLECFYIAHCEDTALDGASEQSRRSYCSNLVKSMFDQTDGDYSSPTKDSILKVVGKLEEFSKNFRDPEVVQKHASEIMMLVGKLED